jgi:hypothetical protein
MNVAACSEQWVGRTLAAAGSSPPRPLRRWPAARRRRRCFFPESPRACARARRARSRSPETREALLAVRLPTQRMLVRVRSDRRLSKQRPPQTPLEKRLRSLPRNTRGKATHRTMSIAASAACTCASTSACVAASWPSSVCSRSSAHGNAANAASHSAAAPV